MSINALAASGMHIRCAKPSLTSAGPSASLPDLPSFATLSLAKCAFMTDLPPEALGVDRPT